MGLLLLKPTTEVDPVGLVGPPVDECAIEVVRVRWGAVVGQGIHEWIPFWVRILGSTNSNASQQSGDKEIADHDEDITRQFEREKDSIQGSMQGESILMSSLQLMVKTTSVQHCYRSIPIRKEEFLVWMCTDVCENFSAFFGFLECECEESTVVGQSILYPSRTPTHLRGQ
jgi:hypothetical protein